LVLLEYLPKVGSPQLNLSIGGTKISNVLNVTC